MRHAALVALLCAGACADEPEDCPDGPQYVLEDGGRVAFYAGCDVRRELADQGSFEPDLADDFTVIEIPSKLMPSPVDPTTVSLCGDWDVRVEFHDSECTVDPSPENPIVTVLDDGACIIHGESGEPGIAGMVQIRWKAGSIEAYAGFRADVTFPGEYGPEGLRYGRGGIPSDLEDPSLEDPLLSDCGLRDDDDIEE